jgi:serine phosphatase RsbU (regulator of sigma subunit)
LPIGVLDEVRPKITKAVLTDGDFVVLTSDGIDEAFSGDRVKLANFINNLKVRTPQELADVIMQEGLNRSGKIMRDDSTVIVAKLIEIIDEYHARK